MPLRRHLPSIKAAEFDEPFALRWAGQPPGEAQVRRSKAELLRRAREAGIDGRSSMCKRELAAALRDH
jgi:hypothetical protein